MPKTKISEFSSTPANNTDIDSINIAEGCSPSGINDAIRELMAQLKDFQTGAVGDSFNGPVGTTTAAAGAFTTLAASSTLNVTGVSTLTAGAVVQGLTVGRGAGAQSLNSAVGNSALAANTTGNANTAFGYFSTLTNTTGNSNTAQGVSSLRLNTTGSNNVAVGQDSLYSNTTASYNTAVGYQAGYNNTTGTVNTIVGRQAGYSNTTGSYNTFMGEWAGYNTTGGSNAFFGQGAGYLVTTGSKNTILGAYNGNQGGLDIRTSNNFVVLSDGDGNPRAYWNSANLLTNKGIVRSTTTSGFAVFGGAGFTLGASSSVQISGGSAAQVICVANGSSGEGGVFFANFNTTVSQIAGSTNGISTTDSGSSAITVYKNSSSNDVFVKNRSASSITIYISVFCGENGGSV